MLSPRKEQYSTTPTKSSPRIPLQRGLFVDGVWRCNCRDRPPAARFQTKNHGVNHGRWFYTCGQPPQSRCKFFLWANDAEVREKGAVLSNPRDEASYFPSPTAEVHKVRVGELGWTPPSKRAAPTGTHGGSGDDNDNGNGNGHGNTRGLLTPQTESKTQASYPRLPADSTSGSFETPSKSTGASTSKSAKARMMEEDGMPGDYNGMGKPSSFADRLQRASGQQGLGSFLPSSQDAPSPRKMGRTTTVVASPGKRKRVSDIEDRDGDDGLRTQEQTQAFSSPSQSHPHSRSQQYPSWSQPPSSAELCQTPTPTKYTNVLSANPSLSTSQQQQQPTDLANQTLSLLESQGVVIPRSTQDDLVALLNRHEMQMKGVVRGRDVTRTALKKKEEELVRLGERVEWLERERERDRGFIDGLSK